MASLFLMTLGASMTGFCGAARPNVVFIALDDLKPALGCFGDRMAKTPNMDRLASKGMVFSNNHCQQAVCGPTRASLLTGWLPDRTQIWDLNTKMRDRNPDILTLPQHFKQNGYYTIGVGKLFDGRCVDSWGKQDAISWSRPYMLTGSGSMYADESYSSGRVPLDKRDTLKRPSTENADVPDMVYKDYHLCSQAIAELENRVKAGDPFFLGLGFSRPHLPFNAPKRYWDLWERSDFALPDYRDVSSESPMFSFHNSGELRNGYTGIPLKGPIPDEKQLELIHGYYATVAFVDAQVGRMLDAVDAAGVGDNTIIVLWGDHGFHLGDHGIFCKHTNYEQATRAPLIISAPGMPEGVKTDSPTEFLDIFPTLCSLAGLSTPSDLDGVSLAPLMDGSKSSVREFARSQYPRKHEGKHLMGYAYRSERYRYVEWIQKDFYKGKRKGKVVARELYDYELDPEESTNLASSPSHRQAREWFKSRLNAR
jgi:arylsulfatase A-like enzyme